MLLKLEYYTLDYSNIYFRQCFDQLISYFRASLVWLEALAMCVNESGLQLQGHSHSPNSQLLIPFSFRASLVWLQSNFTYTARAQRAQLYLALGPLSQPKQLVTHSPLFPLPCLPIPLSYLPISCFYILLLYIFLFPLLHPLSPFLLLPTPFPYPHTYSLNLSPTYPPLYPIPTLLPLSYYFSPPPPIFPSYSFLFSHPSLVLPFLCRFYAFLDIFKPIQTFQIITRQRLEVISVVVCEKMAKKFAHQIKRDIVDTTGHGSSSTELHLGNQRVLPTIWGGNQATERGLNHE